MQYKFFCIPIHDKQGVVEELNLFLRTNKVNAINKELVQDGANSFWAVDVEFAGGEKEGTNREYRGEQNISLNRGLFSPIAEQGVLLADSKKNTISTKGSTGRFPHRDDQAEGLSPRINRIDGMTKLKISKNGEKFLEKLAKLKKDIK